jgi:hypothetical protein
MSYFFPILMADHKMLAQARGPASSQSMIRHVGLPGTNPAQSRFHRHLRVAEIMGQLLD